MFYTKKFVDKFGQYKFTSSDEENLKNIREYSSLILHELSHLLGIGQAKSKDPISSLFSQLLLSQMLTEAHICEGFHKSVPFSIAINPQTEMSFLFANTRLKDFMGIQHQEVLENTLLGSEHWMLGDQFPFFDLKGDNAAGAVGLSILEQLAPEIGVQDRSAYDIIEFLQTLELDAQPKLVFWSFEQGVASYDYRSSYHNVETNLNGEISRGDEKIQESGEIVFSKNFKNVAEQSLQVSVTHDGAENEDQSVYVQLSCQKFVNTFNFNDFKVLNDSTPINLQRDLNKLSLKAVISQKMKMQNCDRPQDDNQRIFCASFQNVLDSNN